MGKMKTENLTIMILILSLCTYVLECTNIEGKTLDPIYWNSSNPLFKSNQTSDQQQINPAINDKLDIICPRRDSDTDEKGLFYFKLFLVNEKNYQKCNATGGRRLLTCDVPHKEKKYTFYFQEISPSPWGLEFEPGEAYYVISTSDGSSSGIDLPKGGVCTRFNMKLRLDIHPPENLTPDIEYYYPDDDKTDPVNNDGYSHNVPELQNDNENVILTGGDDGNDDAKDPSELGEKVSGNGLIIGAVLGACAVLFIFLLAFLGYKVFQRRRYHKKYPSSSISSTRVSSPLQQVTLVPIPPPSHHGHHLQSRLLSDRERHRSATLSSHGDSRPPPSYNETFLANGGAMVEV